ncbi:integrase core domain-containing protein [Rhizobium paknamense]|uniref:integrase core domain-containing protein n=1 Tax=Rhizobium paknamense TaxID=1206817 RepID=UPI00351FC17A
MAPGQPMQNGFLENFNGSFLNETLFSSLTQARAAITAWKNDYSSNKQHFRWAISPREFAMTKVMENMPNEA